MKFYSNHDVFSEITSVIDLFKRDDKYYIELENSNFYAENGGQIADSGKIENVGVIDVVMEEGRKFHITLDKPSFGINSAVKYQIDERTRIDNSMQHTGQHLLSAVLEREFSIKTVAFRMSKEYSSIDTDKKFLHEDIEKLEDMVMDIIRKNKDIDLLHIESKDIEKYKLRKNVDLTGDVQLVKIGDIDLQACCGTHMDKTGELLLFSIKKVENYKEGSRITFLFGERALNEYRQMSLIVEDLKSLLEVHESEIPFKVTLLKEKEDESRKILEKLRKKTAELIVKEPSYDEDIIFKVLEEDEDIIKHINQLLAKDKKNSLIIDKDNFRLYANINIDGIHAGNLFKELKNSKVRGGGGANSFQASAENLADLENIANKVYEKLEEAYS